MVAALSAFERRQKLTLKELRDAIPPHCFERPLLVSFSYLFRDLALVAVLVYAATFINPIANSWIAPITGPLLAEILRWSLWGFYAFAQGAVACGLWVLAHECGHRAFADSTLVNDVVGFILHSALLVPYHSWRITHSQHHKGNCHMDKDQVFLPSTRSEWEMTHPTKRPSPLRIMARSINNIIGMDELPLGSLLGIIGMLVVGWPAYLLWNASGQKYPVWASHFKPSSPMFEVRQRPLIAYSDVGILITLGCLATAVVNYGWTPVWCYYLAPYLFVNGWLVLYTFLQHTDMKVPHFRGDAWDFTKGALATVDRDYWWLFDSLHHEIGSTHVAHHLFSQMPHYHAREATLALRKKFGEDLILHDSTPILTALLNAWSDCTFVEDTGDILWYKAEGK